MDRAEQRALAAVVRPDQRVERRQVQIDRANASKFLDADPLDIRPIHGSIVRGSTEHVKLRPA
jgi:hypothetical protein